MLSNLVTTMPNHHHAFVSAAKLILIVFQFNIMFVLLLTDWLTDSFIHSFIDLFITADDVIYVKYDQLHEEMYLGQLCRLQYNYTPFYLLFKH